MTGNNANKSINCSVHQCRFHCMGEDYCSLDNIRIASHEPNPTVEECTDCMSFKKK